jgi:hypothetical protein
MAVAGPAIGHTPGLARPGSAGIVLGLDIGPMRFPPRSAAHEHRGLRGLDTGGQASAGPHPACADERHQDRSQPGRTETAHRVRDAHRLNALVPDGQQMPGGSPNVRNGTTPKTVISELGPLPPDVPRDRAGSLEPRLVPKGPR